MSEKTVALLKAFEALPQQDKVDFANALLKQLPPLDSGPLDDELVAKAGDDLAAMLGAEEDDPKTR